MNVKSGRRFGRAMRNLFFSEEKIARTLFNKTAMKFPPVEISC